MTTGSRILVAVRVPIDPQVAFEVFTNEIECWWQPNILFNFTPRSPGVVRFEGGADGRLVEALPNGKIFEIGHVRVWEPGARLVVGWRQAAFNRDQNTEVEVRFEAIGDETRVTVEHRGWDTVPMDHVARHGFDNVVFLRRHGEWWQAMLERLKLRVHARPRRITGR